MIQTPFNTFTTVQIIADIIGALGLAWIMYWYVQIWRTYMPKQTKDQNEADG
jgi:threonine/homoserine/homoserine lactone efflux protein